MITRQQAISESEFHYMQCTRSIGKRGRVIEFTVNYRRNGGTKLWKTRPDEFRVPVKYGIRDCAYVTHLNQNNFHIKSECPLRDKNFVSR